MTVLQYQEEIVRALGPHLRVILVTQSDEVCRLIEDEYFRSIFKQFAQLLHLQTTDDKMAVAVAIDISILSHSSSRHGQSWTHEPSPSSAPPAGCMDKLINKCTRIKALELERSYRGTLALRKCQDAPGSLASLACLWAVGLIAFLVSSFIGVSDSWISNGNWSPTWEFIFLGVPMAVSVLTCIVLLSCDMYQDCIECCCCCDLCGGQGQDQDQG